MPKKLTPLPQKKDRCYGNGIPPFSDDEQEPKQSFQTKSRAEPPLKHLGSINHLTYKIMGTPTEYKLIFKYGDNVSSCKDGIRTEKVIDFDHGEAIKTINHDLLANLHLLQQSVVHSSSESQEILEIEYNFSSEIELSNFRLCRDEISSLIQASDNDSKIRFAYNFATAIAYLFKFVKLGWEDLNEIVVADTKSLKTVFLPIGGHYFNVRPQIVDESSMQIDEQKVLENKDNKAQGKTEEFSTKYVQYLKKLLIELFNPYDPKTKEPKGSQVRAILRNITEMKSSAELLEQICVSLLKLYLETLTANKGVNQAKKTHKDLKCEKKNDKIRKILQCLVRYRYLCVLNIYDMSQKELQALKKTVKNTGFAEYYFLPLHNFVKFILPQTNHFKDQKAMGVSCSALIQSVKAAKYQAALFFSNHEILDITKFIDKFESSHKLNCDLPLKQTITLSVKGLFLADYQKIWFVSLGLITKGDRKSHFDIDWTLEKGHRMHSTEKWVLRAIQDSNPAFKFPVKTKVKILHIFDNGYLLPSQTVKNLHTIDAIVANRLIHSFNMVRAIQTELGQELTDYSNTSLVREKFREGLFHVLHAYIGLNNRAPSQFSRQDLRKVSSKIIPEKSEKEIYVGLDGMFGMFEEDALFEEEDALFEKEGTGRFYDDLY